MNILALDLAESWVGWCKGPCGTTPPARSYRIKNKGEPTEAAIERLGRSLHNLLSAERFDLICAEGLLPAGASKGRFSRDGQVVLHAVVRTVALIHGVSYRAPDMRTIRKHFCGRISAAPVRPRGYKRTPKEIEADREATKLMIIERARLLGYIAKDCEDDNAADAAAAWDFACAHWSQESKLALVG